MCIVTAQSHSSPVLLRISRVTNQSNPEMAAVRRNKPIESPRINMAPYNPPATPANVSQDVRVSTRSMIMKRITNPLSLSTCSLPVCSGQLLKVLGVV